PDGTGGNTTFAGSNPITFANYNNGGTVFGGLDLADGLGTSAVSSGGVFLLNDTVLCTMKIRASASPTGPQPLPITLIDPSTLITAASNGLNDNTNLDPIIVAAAHNNFPLYIQVAVPEPSSMCLAGLAVVGFGWRKLRRKAVVAA